MSFPFRPQPMSQAARQLLTLSTITLLSQAAGAQTAATGQVQDVVVTTGARGDSRTVAESLAPIDVIGEQELARTGKQNLREALSSLAPSYTNTAGFKGQIGLAVNSATLRGLGGTNVLVLINGKRRHISSLLISGTGPVGADLDLIPVAAVERIEVLRDGAAAQYGSDAIAGVINIILKSAKSGGAASVGAGRYMSTVGDRGLYGDTYTLHLNQGFALNEDGFLNIGGTYLKQRATNVAGPVPSTGEPGARSIYFPVNGQPDPRETTVSRYRQVLGRPNSETKTVSFNAEVPVGDRLRAYAFSTVSRRRAQGFGTYRTANAAQNIESVYPDGFLPEFVVDEEDHQLNIGVKGRDLLGWNWDIGTSHGKNDGNSRNENTLNPTLGPASPKNFDNGHLVNTEWTTTFDASRKLATGAFEKPLGIGIGIEYRRTIFAQTPGQYESYADGPYVYPVGHPLAGTKPNPGAAGFAGYSPEVSGEYTRKNAAAYLDLEQQFGKSFTLGAAVRAERYSDAGNVRTGKLSGRLEIAPGYSLRGTASNGFAAPALVQKYFTNVLGAYSTNPITGVLSQSFTRNVPAYDAAARALGAKDLVPEKSRNYSVGFALKPTPDTNVTIDAYQIDIDGRIVLSSTLNSVQIAPVLRAAGLSANQNVSFWLNAGDTQTRGLDLVIDHTQKLAAWGTLKWVLLGNVNKTKLKRIEAPAAQLNGTGAVLIGRDTIGKLTEAYPKYTVALSGTWTYGDVDTTVKATRYAGVIGRNPVAASRDEYVEPATIVDLNIGWWITQKAKVSIGANNIFNKRPEQLNDEAVRFYGFPVGRPNYSWFSPYGVDGGYYYARLDLTW